MRSVAMLTSAAILLGACNDAFSPGMPADRSVPVFSAQGRPGELIPGQYIVVFRNGVLGTESLARTLAGKHSAKLKHTYTSALKGMAVELSDSAAAALRREPAVEYVEQDQMAHVISESIVQPGATMGLDRIDQRSLPLSGSYSYSADGSGVRVYIIDTGIYVNHAEFGGRARTGFDAVSDGGSAADCHGHGTHVAGTAGGTTYGVAKRVTLYAVRVLDCGGSGSYSQVIAGIDWVTANRVLPAVANMSLGGGYSAALNQAVTNSVASGVTYAVAAGNSAIDACIFSPASTPSAITVAASDVSDVFAYFSNSGSCVDIAAPGVDITSAWIGSPEATTTISGTSMASPHVGGAAALYLSVHPSGTPTQVTAALAGSATSGVLTNVPSGTVNRLLYTGAAVPSTWETKPAMLTARRGVAVAGATGILYAIGGNNSAGAALNTVQAYNPSTNTWSTKASLPAARQSGNGATTITGTIYVAGGQDASGALTRTLYAYKSSTNIWTTKANMPAFGGCGGSAVIGGKLYVFSGCTRTNTGGQTAAGLLHRYDPGTNTWATLRPAPAAHFQPAVGSTGGKLYVVGGNNGGSGTQTSRLDVYDPATNTWSTRAAMPTARVAAAGVVAAGKLYVMGGRSSGTTYLNTVEVYDPLTNTWSTGAAMPTPRAALGVGAVSNLLYAVGGRNSASALTTNERFTP